MAAAIERLGLSGAVTFESAVSDDRMVELYAEATVAVVPSLYEGFSLAGGRGHGVRGAPGDDDRRGPARGGRRRRRHRPAGRPRRSRAPWPAPSARSWPTPNWRPGCRPRPGGGSSSASPGGPARRPPPSSYRWTIEHHRAPGRPLPVRADRPLRAARASGPATGCSTSGPAAAATPSRPCAGAPWSPPSTPMPCEIKDVAGMMTAIAAEERRAVAGRGASGAAHRRRRPAPAFFRWCLRPGHRGRGARAHSRRPRRHRRAGPGAASRAAPWRSPCPAGGRSCSPGPSPTSTTTSPAATSGSTAARCSPSGCGRRPASCYALPPRPRPAQPRTGGCGPLVGVADDAHPLVRAYHRVLVWDITAHTAADPGARSAAQPGARQERRGLPEEAGMTGPADRRPRSSDTASWIAAVQLPNGMIPWFPGGHADPWNHTESAMALVLAGRRREADRAFEWLASTPAARRHLVPLPPGRGHRGPAAGPQRRRLRRHRGLVALPLHRRPRAARGHVAGDRGRGRVRAAVAAAGR